MNSELSSSRSHKQFINEPLRANAPSVSSPSGARSDYSSPNQLDSEGDDALFARAATMMMDLPASKPEEVVRETANEPLKYVQGVVQGQRVYIITNVLEESQMLVQPQMVWTIGRNRDAALPLKDRAMSRRHAVLLYIRDSGFQLIDLNSMNGSFVNGIRIQKRYSLKDGDQLRIGSTNFTFFVTQNVRMLEPIHPEVLARFSASQSHAAFNDYAALEEPESLFKTPPGHKI